MIEVRDQLIKYLEGSGWDMELYHYLHGEEFLQVLAKLKDLADDGKRWCPQAKEMLKFLKVCPFDKIKIVMLVDDWSSNFNKQGIPLSQNTEQMKKDEFKPDIKICTRKDVAELVKPLIPFYKKFDYNLERWCKQGVLMIPLSPTCRIDGKQHYKIWKEFINRIIEAINSTYKTVPWMLVERGTWSYEMDIESKYTMLYTSFPACSDERWFTKLNEHLVNHKQEPIKW